MQYFCLGSSRLSFDMSHINPRSDRTVVIQHGLLSISGAQSAKGNPAGMYADFVGFGLGWVGFMYQIDIVAV